MYFLQYTESLIVEHGYTRGEINATTFYLQVLLTPVASLKLYCSQRDRARSEASVKWFGSQTSYSCSQRHHVTTECTYEEHALNVQHPSVVMGIARLHGWLRVTGTMSAELEDAASSHTQAFSSETGRLLDDFTLTKPVRR